MRKVQIIPLTIFLTLVILSTIFTSDSLANNIENKKYNVNLEYYNKGYKLEIQGWIYIHIEGEPYDRGYQYGYLVSEEIIDIIYRWCQWGNENRIINIRNEKDTWDLYKKHAKELFLDKIPEEYIKEMKGIACGINNKGIKLFGKKIEFEDILTLQLFQDVFYSCFKYKLKKFHPIRGAISGIKNFLSKIMGKSETEHCMAFIATGDATKNGEIIVAHSTLFNPVIAEKCNIILDVKPIGGYRFIMTTYPGAIWSCEDYYQNEKGIILTETELQQGPWTKDGIPKGVRSRNAIQYSDSIDDVINYLMDGNNGLIPNEWLIGDAKTGEISSLEQALFNTPVKRTFNGFYWSCNYPHNLKVKRELYGVSSFLLDISMKIMSNNVFSGKIKKLIEIVDKFYGKLDIEKAKEILATSPLSNGATDGKITSSSLLIDDMIFFAHFGNPDGSTWVPTKDFKDKYSMVTTFPAMGWVEINPSKIIMQNIQPIDLTRDKEKDIVQGQKDELDDLIYIIAISVLSLFIVLFFILYYKRMKR